MVYGCCKTAHILNHPLYLHHHRSDTLLHRDRQSRTAVLQPPPTTSRRSNSSNRINHVLRYLITHSTKMATPRLMPTQRRKPVCPVWACGPVLPKLQPLPTDSSQTPTLHPHKQKYKRDNPSFRQSRKEKTPFYIPMSDRPTRWTSCPVWIRTRCCLFAFRFWAYRGLCWL